MARLFIIAGCNGAGKTTASYTVLPELLNLHKFVNADEIADELSPQNPEREMVRAARLMIEQVEQLIGREEDFALETTLATKSLSGTIVRAQQRGYTAGILYFWLKSPELAIRRVHMRVAAGGHNIPIDTIVRRYHQGMENLRKIYLPLCDYWMLIDNSSTRGFRVAEGGTGRETQIYNKRIYQQIIQTEKT